MVSTLTLRVSPFDPGVMVIDPLVDGRQLVDLVTEFETERGWSSAGGYGGLVPDFFNFGDLGKYFLGVGDRQWPGPGELWLLGCQCGEVGCWPLKASVSADSTTVTWSDFVQTYRASRDYSGFGPFTFGRAQYDAQVQAAIQTLADNVR